MDYMGSAEFEFGALPAALVAMRTLWCTEWEPKRIKHDGAVAWFIGPPTELEKAEKLFEDQLGPRKMRLKEDTRIAIAYDRGDYPKDDHFDVVGWWALTSSPWALFIKKKDAITWMRCIASNRV